MGAHQMKKHHTVNSSEVNQLNSSNSIYQNRRTFLKNGAYLASVIGAGQFVPIQALSAAGLQKPDWYLEDWNPDESFLTWGKTLRVQPILHYKVAQPREMTSWRSWGGVLSDESANE